ncbi:MAG: RNA binding protein [Caudoviricetes sp.]|nr:MAG: RNA binding protein [Caudoviricetes sp.]
MGKLVLTRRAGESVIVREANGANGYVQAERMCGHLGIRLYRSAECIGRSTSVFEGQSISFAGGSLELRPARCPSQAILAFDFPRDVTILRTEIA